MTAFKIKQHLEMDENYQGINLTVFDIVVIEQIDNDLIVATFIRSKEFIFDSLRDCIKAEPDKGYLRRAFEFDRIEISEFRKTDKQGVTKFLIDYSNEADWGDDRQDFLKLIDRYLKIHNQLSESEFYIISKDWFDKDDEKLVEPESWCYTYYFLIISIDRNSGTLSLSEFTYD